MNKGEIISLAEARKRFKDKPVTSGRNKSASSSNRVKTHRIKTAGDDFESELERFKSSIRFNPLVAESQLSLGNFLLDKRREHLALDAYQSASRLDPERWEPWFNAGIIYLNVFRTMDKARECFETSLRLNPEHAGSYLNMSISIAESGDPEKACEILQEASEICPGNVDIWNNLGVFLARTGQRDKALKAWDEAIKRAPMEMEAHFNQAVTYTEMQIYDAALMCYRRCLKCGRVEPDILLNMAEIQEIKHDYPGALRNFRRCLKIQPGNLAARRGEGVVLVKAGNRQLGKEKLEEILAEVPRDEETLIRLGLICADESDYNGAKRYFQMALDQRKYDPDLNFNMGSVFEGIGDFKEAVKYYGEAIRLDPFHQEAYLKIGKIFMDNNEPEKALEIYHTGVLESGDSAMLAYAEGKANERLSRFTNAINSYKRAIKLEPAFITAYFELGSLYYEKNQKSKAAFTFERILELDPKNYAIRVELGVILYESGRVNEAREQFDIALENRSGYSKGLYYLGVLEIENGDSERGEMLLKWCLDSDPGGDWGELARKRLNEKLKKQPEH